MTKEASPSPTAHYMVPARQLSGTRDEVLAQIDELIVGLTGLRQLVSMHGPTPAEAPGRKLRLVKGFLKVLLLFSSALCVSPAQAQTPAPSPSQGEIQPAEGSVTQQTSDPWRGVTFGATIETFYQYNWNRSPDRSLLLRAYDTRANTFGLQQAAFVIDAAPDVEDNQAFSRAYLFNFLPFYHSGVRLTLPVTDGVSLLYMLSNGIQQTEDFNDFKSNHFAAVLKPTRRVTWVANYYFGRSGRTVASQAAQTAISGCSTPTSRSPPRRGLRSARSQLRHQRADGR